ncbi:MAG: peptidylprolyl isomerase [Bacteroidales bacterium]|nr:peptidylprolyl isomerase [Bacteroidales bacterium]
MQHFFITIFLLAGISLSAQAASSKLLDKIAAIVDDNIITLSQVKRIQSNVPARRSISPMIYTKNKYSKKEVIKIIINKYLIRNYLQTVGYVISDEQVDSQIKQTEKRLRLTRPQLLDFLKSNKMSFQEYFQLTKETIEYMSLFLPRVIVPLVSISEYEIKNFYYKKNANNKTLSFRYTLNDFSFPRKKISKKDLGNIKNILANFQITGNLPSKLQDIETNVISDVTEDGLLPLIKKALKKTNEGSFTNPVLLNDEFHVFFIKKKDLVASEKFLQVKKQIEAELKEIKIKSVVNSWFDREQTKHFVKYNL